MTEPNAGEPVDILGCPFAPVTLDQAVAIVEDYLKDGRLHQSVGVNVDQLRLMKKDPVFERAVLEADLITADGQPIVWMSHLLGTPLPERVPGIDLFEALLVAAEQKGYRIFLLGAKEQSMQAAAKAYKQAHPDLQIAGMRNGYFSVEDEPEIVEQINGSGAQMLFLAISSPKKEDFVNRNRADLKVAFVLGVGGAFDIAAGLASRSPRWMRPIGLEWVWRIIQEPRRMAPRYAENFRFLTVMGKEVIRNRWSRFRNRRQELVRER